MTDTLIVHDFSCLVHQIKGYTNPTWDEAKCTKAAKLLIYRILQNTWHREFTKDSRKVVNILAIDSKSPDTPTWEGKPHYWRTPLLWELGIKYKDGRPPTPPQFGMIYDAAIAFAKEMKLPVVAVPTAEADDVAAVACRVWDERIMLHTIDADWMGLVEDGRVAWVCCHGYIPRIRMAKVSVRVWCNKRMGKKVNTVEEIWPYKAEKGDKSDNLPPGSPLWAIDLKNPHENCPIKQLELACIQAIHLAYNETKPLDETKLINAVRWGRANMVSSGISSITKEQVREHNQQWQADS